MTAETAAIATIAGAATAGGEAGGKAARDHALIGTWRLVSFEQWTDGQVSYPMGHDARGYISYDTAGRMSVQIMRAGRPAVAAGKWSEGTLEELRAAAGGFLSYGGTYTVDEPHALVAHLIDIHLLPNAVGTKLERRFAIEGDQLTLLTAPLVPGGRLDGGRLVWERVATSVA